MSLINIANLTFAYDGGFENIFENVSLQIDTGWRLGFTGRNGRGKTTFLNLLLGKYSYIGNIAASVRFEYFPFDVTDEQADTLSVLKSINANFSQWELIRELSLLDVSEDVLYRPFGTLSNGEQTKVLLAALFLKSNSFLLIDEPTNHLDMKGRATLSAYLKKKSGFILVSHDRDFLDGCIDHILSINKANIEIQKGNFSSWIINKERQDRFEIAENEKLRQEVKRLAKTAREKAAWSDRVEATKNGTLLSGIKADKGRIGHKAAKMMKRAKAIEGRQQAAIAEKSKLLKNIENADALKIVSLTYHTSRLAELKDICVFYGEKAACRNVSFSIAQGERIALCGKNGCGKSSVIKLLCGEDVCHTGDFSKGSKLVISYVSQDTSHLTGNLTDYAAAFGIDASLFKAILRKLDFARLQFEKDMRSFSGGQKKKVLIARSLCEQAHLYIWDEPLNYVDVISRIQIKNLILEYRPTMLFAEHDSAFCKDVATNVIYM